MLFTSNRMKQLGISLVMSLIIAGWRPPGLPLTRPIVAPWNCERLVIESVRLHGLGLA
jgi:hypothetical protein